MENEEKLAGGNGQIRNVFSGWYAGDYNFYLPFKGEESAYLAIPSSIVSVSLVSVKRLGHLDSIPVDVTREEILSVAERYKSDIIARGAGSYRKKSLDFKRKYFYLPSSKTVNEVIDLSDEICFPSRISSKKRSSLLYFLLTVNDTNALEEISKRCELF